MPLDFLVASADTDDAARRHRVTRVDRQIDDSDFKFIDVDGDRPKPILQLNVDADISRDRRRQNITEAVEAFPEVDGFWLERPPASKSQQSASQIFGAGGRDFDRVNRAFVLWVTQPALEVLRIAAYDHQHVVEVVGDAAGQLAERVHLLRLRQLLLRALQRELAFAAFGDVAGDLGKAGQFAFFIVDGVDDDAGPKPRSVLAHAPALGLVASFLPRHGEGSQARRRADPPACRRRRNAFRRSHSPGNP